MQHNKNASSQKLCKAELLFLVLLLQVERIRLFCPRKKSEKNLSDFTTLFFQQVLFFSAWSISNKNCYRFQSTVSFGIYFSNVFWSSNRRLAIPSFYDGSIFYRSPILSMKKRKWREKLNISVRRFQAETFTWQGSIHWVWQIGNRQNEFVVPKLLRQIVSMFSEEMAISSDHFLRTRYKKNTASSNVQRRAGWKKKTLYSLLISLEKENPTTECLIGRLFQWLPLGVKSWSVASEECRHWAANG